MRFIKTRSTLASLSFTGQETKHTIVNVLLLLSEESLAVIQIGNTTGVLFLLFLLLYWHVPSPDIILPVKTRIILKSLNKVCKQTTLRNVKRDNGRRENTAFVNKFYEI